MTKLHTLANEKFGTLSRAEELIISLAPQGKEAWCGPSTEYENSTNDPTEARKWPQDRNVRASLLSWLYSPKVTDLVDAAGITVIGANIVGTLDFLCARL